MWCFKTHGFKFLAIASVYCSVYSPESGLNPRRWKYNWDKSHGIHDDSMFKSKSNALNVVKYQQPYYKLIIFIRHGQYHLSRKKSEEKVLTDIGWQQAFATGCRLREMGIEIDRIIHSDLIRARQTTAAVLVGLLNDSDSLFDSPEIVQLVIPDPSRLDEPKSLPVSQKSNPGNTFLTLKSNPLVENIQMTDQPYTPYINATFDCQLSRYLTEGPPPVSPVPPTSSTKKSDIIRSTEGIRIDKGFQAHLHRQPITEQGIIACNGPLCCPIKCCCQLSNKTELVKCNCPCHRIVQHKPIETIVFIGHANVFRYWICRLLQLPCEAWLRLSLGHGSISTLIITNELMVNYEEDEEDVDNVSLKYRTNSKYGSVVTLSHFGDVGHLPPELITY
ncbi:hypothetical protein MN116_008232 [Schistosoma mekongi]|uniref:Serine/threonine-protein phosphatase PGAM5, mitochondrial n=1 Tax=Schistosoma mekongi TaxID=38744 RepID=A0AAE2D1T1_SCHME|nr:hypothetical protein MN116_008232 [Schistosoma mekongi]